MQASDYRISMGCQAEEGSAARGTECDDSAVQRIHQLPAHTGGIQRAISRAFGDPIQRVHGQSRHTAGVCNGRPADGMVQQHVLSGDFAHRTQLVKLHQTGEHLAWVLTCRFQTCSRKKHGPGFERFPKMQLWRLGHHGGKDGEVSQGRYED